VRSEYIGVSVSRSPAGLKPVLDDDTGIAVDQAIARCEAPTRKMIKRVYLYRNISITPLVLNVYLEEFDRSYSGE